MASVTGFKLCTKSRIISGQKSKLNILLIPCDLGFLLRLSFFLAVRKERKPDGLAPEHFQKWSAISSFLRLHAKMIVSKESVIVPQRIIGVTLSVSF